MTFEQFFDVRFIESERFACRAAWDARQGEIDDLQETITACEREVSLVYWELTCGRFSKMNTKASCVIDEIREVAKRDHVADVEEMSRQIAKLEADKLFLQNHNTQIHKDWEACRNENAALREKVRVAVECIEYVASDNDGDCDPWEHCRDALAKLLATGQGGEV